MSTEASGDQGVHQAAQGGRGLSFRSKLLLVTCGLVLLTGALVLLVADRSGRESTRVLVDSLFRQVSGDAANQTRAFVSRAAPVAQTLGQLALPENQLALNEPERLAWQLVAFLNGNPGLTRVLYGSETGEYTAAARQSDGSLRFERTFKNGDTVSFVEFAVLGDRISKEVKRDNASGYDPRKRPFYTLAVEKGRLSWTPPYMFFTEGVPGISCVLPVRDANEKLRGVLSVEFDLRALSEFVSALSISEHSSVFLFTPDGTLLAHRNLRNAKASGVKGAGAMLTLADTNDGLVDAFRANLRGGDLNSGAAAGYRFFEFSNGGTDYLASTTVFPVGDGQSWVVGAVAPESDFLGAVQRARLMALLAAGGALCLAVVVAGLMARHISNPVQALITFVRRVGDGDLEAKADFHGGREFKELSGALNRMIVDLRERLQLRNSLRVAMEVQKSLLPAADPVSPRLDVAGRSKYCDETGGDYYDFIDVSPVTPASLLVAVGDVMGHGIPSALVMATVRAALRTTAMHDHPPRLAELMTRTNRVLASDNRHNRFVTLSLLLIDAETRLVRWASAGHDPAVVYDPATDTTRELEGGDMPLGLSDGVEYEEYSSEPLPAEAVVIIGTDGIWEMADEQNRQYGKERMQKIIREHHAQPSSEIAAALEADLTAFRGTRNPMDDVTFVIVKLRP
ncbi:MAG: SpoIIE family protein phosphatase [Phycisphaerales bacterium]